MGKTKAKAVTMSSVFGIVFAGDIRRLRELPDFSASVNACSSNFGTTLLYTAARQGHVECARTLLATHGADVNAANANESGSTALHGACYGGHAAVVALLVQHGATAAANTFGETPEANAKCPAAGVTAAAGAACVAALVAAPASEPTLKKAKKEAAETPAAAPTAVPAVSAVPADSART
jgi:ankyrin repeat protein